MTGKISKIMAVAITAMFCVAAFAAILPSDDSSADSVNYNFYVQIVDKDKNFVSKEWYTVSEPSVSMNNCIDATKTFAKHGINASLSTSGWWTGPTIGGTAYYASVLYASGNDWKVISDTAKDYAENTIFAVTFYASSLMDTTTYAAEPVTITIADYNKLSADEKKNYATDDYYAYLLPGVSTKAGSESRVAGTTGAVTYHFYVKVVDESKTFVSSKWYSAGETEKSMAKCIDAVSILQKYGIDASLSTSGWWTGPTINGTAYYASVLYASGNDWKVISDTAKDYAENTTFAVTLYASTNMDPLTYAAEPVTKTLADYNKLSDNDKKNYLTDDYSAYLLPGVSTTDYNEPASNDNTTTIIIVAVVVIVVIIAIVAVVLIKKKG